MATGAKGLLSASIRAIRGQASVFPNPLRFLRLRLWMFSPNPQSASRNWGFPVIPIPLSEFVSFGCPDSPSAFRKR